MSKTALALFGIIALLGAVAYLSTTSQNAHILQEAREDDIFVVAGNILLSLSYK
jgi:hypothetical protein